MRESFRTVAGRSPSLRGALLLAFACAVALALVACGGGKSGPEKAQEAVAKGLVAHQAGNLEAAEPLYREALKHEPGNKFALFDLGLIYHTRGDAVQAENYYRLSMASDPAFTPPIYNMAVLRRDANQLQEAGALYSRVLALDPNNALAHYNFGLVLRRLGLQAEGDVEIGIARRIDPNVGGGATASPSVTPAPGN